MFTPEVCIMMTAYMLGVMSPGPDFIMIVRNSAGSTRTIGLLTAAGLALGIFIHNTYSILGFGLFLNQYPIILQIVKYIGASYLAYIAYKCFRTRKPTTKHTTIEANTSTLTKWEAFRMGFITEITNPNAAFFIITLFSGVKGITILHFMICSALVASLTFCWYGFVAVALTHPPLQEKFIDYKHWINWAAGCFLIFFALQLVLN